MYNFIPEVYLYAIINTFIKLLDVNYRNCNIIFLGNEQCTQICDCTLDASKSVYMNLISIEI